MHNKTLKTIIFTALLLGAGLSARAQKDTLDKPSRLTIGGYGEAVYNYNFYSDNVFRYSHADRYTESKGHGRVDLPHAVITLGYDMGRGWSVGTEVEFEHGGTEKRKQRRRVSLSKKWSVAVRWRWSSSGCRRVSTAI